VLKPLRRKTEKFSVPEEASTPWKPLRRLHIVLELLRLNDARLRLADLGVDTLLCELEHLLHAYAVSGANQTALFATGEVPGRYAGRPAYLRRTAPPVRATP
jgi:hypothetical protein